jgi:catechol 2,3-dioxygenase-like lactoylglutathione lyase family enzyme
MRQRVHLITLGVEAPERAAAFYEALGWRRVPDTPPGIAVFDLWGASLGLYGREALARDMGREVPRGSGAITLACNVRSREAVAETLAAAGAAGARVLREAHDAAWGGHIGYFEDPDGHAWEVAFNPFSPLGPHDEFQWNGAGAADAV